MTILIALIPTIMWGSIGLVSGLLGGKPRQQTVGMTFGILILGFCAVLVFKPEITVNDWIFGLISGFFWIVLGQNQLFKSMESIGVSKTMPIAVGLQLVLTSIAGIVLFNEWQTNRDLLLGSIALLLLILGATFTVFEQQLKVLNGSTKPQLTTIQKYSPVVISALGYVLANIIIRYGQTDFGVTSVAVILPQAIGMVVGGLVFSMNRDILHKKTAANIITGLVWGVGNIFMLISMEKIGLATSFSLSQAGIFISTLGGIFLLGEHKTKKEFVYTIIGCILVVGGGVLIGLMKA